MMLSREKTEELARRTGYDPQEVPEYGSDLPALVTAYREFGEWLEAALHAGHLPTPEGVHVAVVGWHLQYEEEVEGFRARGGVEGDVEFASRAHARWCHHMAAVLERFACEAERAVEEVQGEAAREPTSDFPHEQLAGEAAERRRRSMERATAAEADCEPTEPR